MVDLPPPPVPADADLTHFDDMPLEVRRLRDSGIAGVADAEVFRCGVLSWCASWHQIPAGSLPSDDADLCRLVGLGRDLKTWRRIKASAMRGWRPFADGRLYHPVVAEKVIERWNGHLLNRWGKQCDLIRKQNKDRATRKEGPLPFPPKPARIPHEWPPDETWNSTGKDAPAEAVSVGIPTEKALKGKERKGKESPTVEEAAASFDAPRARKADFPAESRPPTPPEIDEAFALWAPIAYELRIPDPGFANDERRKLLASRLAECGIEGFRVAMANLREAKWLRDPDDPSKPKHWVNLATLLKPETFTGLLEGRYAEQHESADGLHGNLQALAAWGRTGSG